MKEIDIIIFQVIEVIAGVSVEVVTSHSLMFVILLLLIILKTILYYHEKKKYYVDTIKKYNEYLANSNSLHLVR